MSAPSLCAHYRYANLDPRVVIPQFRKDVGSVPLRKIRALLSENGVVMVLHEKSQRSFSSFC